MYTTLPFLVALLSGTAFSTPLMRRAELDTRNASPFEVKVEVTPSGDNGLSFDVPDVSEIIAGLELDIPGVGTGPQDEVVEGSDGAAGPDILVPSASAVAMPIPIPSAAAAILPLNTTLPPHVTMPANTTFTNTTINSINNHPPNASPLPLASLVPSSLSSSIAEALQDEFAERGNVAPSKVKRDPAPAAEAEPVANLLKEKIKAATTKLPTFPGMGNVVGGAAESCNSSNTQVNQCSSGVPFCCSPDGNGGQTCMDSTVNCEQTIICCNNFNGFQFCMGDMDFNIPITINMNLGKDKKRHDA